mgnify:CR=1 FL=1
MFLNVLFRFLNDVLTPFILVLKMKRIENRERSKIVNKLMLRKCDNIKKNKQQLRKKNI